MRVDKHFLKVKDILFEAVCHLFNLNQFVSVVLIKHALHAHCDATLLAEVLNRLLCVSGTEDKALSTISSLGK